MSTEVPKIENEFEETLTTGQLFFELVKVILLAFILPAVLCFGAEYGTKF